MAKKPESCMWLVLSNRLLKKCFKWFDKLTTNGYILIISMLPPFALSLSKGERKVFQQPAKVL